MQTHLTMKSSNVKTGPIPVSTTESKSCPKSCPHYNTTCYASMGPLNLHWKAVDGGKRGSNWKEFCATIASLPDGQLWRHNQAGDLPGIGGRINKTLLGQLVDANKGKNGFTYTHKCTSESNINTVRQCNADGFTVNASADNINQADKFVAAGLPTVVVVNHDQTENFTTPAGNKVVICPATKQEYMSCAVCKLCAKGDRKSIVAFPAHGVRKKQIKIKLVS